MSITRRPFFSISSVCRVVFFPREILREMLPVSRFRSSSAFSSVLLPAPLCPVRQQRPPEAISSRTFCRPVCRSALTPNTGMDAAAYSRRIHPARSGSRSDLFTTIATSIPWASAREICRSARSISGSGTGARTMTSIVTLATGGLRHSVSRGRNSSSHPCSSPCPGVKRTRSPTIGVILSRRNFFLQRTVNSAPCSVRTV